MGCVPISKNWGRWIGRRVERDDRRGSWGNGLIHPSRQSGINAVLVCVCDSDNLEHNHSRSWRRRRTTVDDDDDDDDETRHGVTGCCQVTAKFWLRSSPKRAWNRCCLAAHSVSGHVRSHVKGVKSSASSLGCWRGFVSRWRYGKEFVPSTCLLSSSKVT